MMTLGERIKLLRTNQGMSQPDLANKAEIEQSYLSKVENEKSIPSFEIISRIAAAFEMSGIELVNTLSRTYIENSLNHIPEISAEYSSIMKKMETKLKRRYIFSAILFLIGLVIFLFSRVPMGEVWFYQSDGVVKAEENIMQFLDRPIMEIGESGEEYQLRRRGNGERFDREYKEWRNFKGQEYVEELESGKRLFILVYSHPYDGKDQSLRMILGLFIIFCSLFMFLYSFKFKEQ